MSESPIAILTGGGTGIGRDVALQLAASGWRIAIVGRRGALLDDTLATIRAQHPHAEALAVAVDIAEQSAASRVVANTVQKWGPRIDGLINNAAVLIREPIDKASEESIRQSFEVNVLAPMRLVREVWPMPFGADVLDDLRPSQSVELGGRRFTVTKRRLPPGTPSQSLLLLFNPQP